MRDEIDTLHDIKARHGLTYAQLAERIGVSWRNLFRWMKREHTPSRLGMMAIRLYIKKGE